MTKLTLVRVNDQARLVRIEGEPRLGFEEIQRVWRLKFGNWNGFDLDGVRHLYPRDLRGPWSK